MGAGHYGIFSGRRWREDVYPRLREFIAQHDASKAATPKRTRAKPVPAVKAAKEPGLKLVPSVKSPASVAAPIARKKATKATPKRQQAK